MYAVRNEYACCLYLHITCEDIHKASFGVSFRQANHGTKIGQFVPFFVEKIFSCTKYVGAYTHS
jgi:hypothetical protein